MSKLVPLPSSIPSVLKDYLPTPTSNGLPFVTLTYATSLDSRISAAPGIQTIISHPETKTMTHYLRYHHDAILVGVGTVLADDPGLNCRWTPESEEDGSQSQSQSHSIHLIQPIVIDPKFKWDPRGSRLLRTAAEGGGLAPYIVVNEKELSKNENGQYSTDILEKIRALEAANGKIIIIPSTTTKSNNNNFNSVNSNQRTRDTKDNNNITNLNSPNGVVVNGSSSSSSDSVHTSMSWQDIFEALYKETTSTGKPIRSIMVEGGATVINSLLDEASWKVETSGPPPLVSSIVVTVGPVFLGSRGVSVSPVTSQPRLNNVRWWTGSRDAVVCGRLL